MHSSEQMSIESQNSGLFQLESQLENQNICMKELAELIPGYVHFNNLNDFGLIYADHNSEAYFNLSTDEIKKAGFKFVEDHFHPETWNTSIPEIIYSYQLNARQKVFGYFLKIRKSVNADYQDFIVFTTVCEKFNCFLSISNPVGMFGMAAGRLNLLLEDNEFTRLHYNNYTRLTCREIEILRLVGKGISRNSISERLFISKHTLDNHRKHIRQKLNIKNTAELFRYISNFHIF